MVSFVFLLGRECGLVRCFHTSSFRCFLIRCFTEWNLHQNVCVQDVFSFLIEEYAWWFFVCVGAVCYEVIFHVGGNRVSTSRLGWVVGAEQMTSCTMDVYFTLVLGHLWTFPIVNSGVSFVDVVCRSHVTAQPWQLRLPRSADIACGVVPVSWFLSACCASATVVRCPQKFKSELCR